MNAKTVNINLTLAERHELYLTWRALFAKRECASVDFMIYALLRGTNPRAGFTPISNPRKLSNGMQAEQGYRAALLAIANQAGHLLSAKLRVLFPSATAERLAELVGGVVTEASALYYGKKEA